VEEEIKKKLVGIMLAARGNMSKGDFGMTLVASDVWVPLDTTKEKANELLGRV
jgi:replication factor A1